MSASEMGTTWRVYPANFGRINRAAPQCANPGIAKKLLKNADLMPLMSFGGRSMAG